MQTTYLLLDRNFLIPESVKPDCSKDFETYIKSSVLSVLTHLMFRHPFGANSNAKTFAKKISIYQSFSVILQCELHGFGLFTNADTDNLLKIHKASSRTKHFRRCVFILPLGVSRRSM